MNKLILGLLDDTKQFFFLPFLPSVMTTLPNTFAANTGAMQQRPIGFLALWKSFNTLITSSFTVQDTPLTAKSLLPKYKHSSLVCLPAHYQTTCISASNIITHSIFSSGIIHGV
jgi:hypothetical protein